MSKLMAAEAK